MENSCAVCAEPLHWIAYGVCGHRDVCSTCTARMRVVLGDRRCCICKQESPWVFITQNLGESTKVIKDFKLYPRGFLYEAAVKAYFDDEGEFRRINAMCKMQCNICEQSSFDIFSMPVNFVKKGHCFKNLELLRQHILTAHKLTMCDLCVEGRKVFVIEQKLYTNSELERHCSKGDEDGCNGHPLCQFCMKRFYGETELYRHLSTEHYTCHLCQRDRAGQFEYFNSYEDLESHFRTEHFLCENLDCLAKKFIVFKLESELKVHNAKEHAQNLTRAERKIALKINVPLLSPGSVSSMSSIAPPHLSSSPSPSTFDASAFPPLPGSSRRRIRRENENVAPDILAWRADNASFQHRIDQVDSEAAQQMAKHVFQQIKLHLNNDEKKIAEFKRIHSDFRKDALSSKCYYSLLTDLGLEMVIPDLARSWPDPKKQQALLEEHARRRSLLDSYSELLRLTGNLKTAETAGHSKGKTKVLEAENLPAPCKNSGSQASTSAYSTWTCQLCTLINRGTGLGCAACGSVRKLERATGQMKNVPAARMTSSMSGPGVWKNAVRRRDTDLKGECTLLEILTAERNK